MSITCNNNISIDGNLVNFFCREIDRKRRQEFLLSTPLPEAYHVTDCFSLKLDLDAKVR